jgi:adenine-specific DNA-methyltransferase
LQCVENVPVLKEVKNRKIVKSDTLQDNLLIEGDNYHALSVLNYTHKNKIDVIYIDPPYNTGSDDFKYNDRFNHSTWLVFMKNRLEVAKELLSEDGLIFVHCDNNEQAYLKILMDEIYGRDNFLETITVVNNPRGRDYGALANMHEFMCVFSKTYLYEAYKLYDEEKEFPYKDTNGEFEIRELRNRNIKFNKDNRPNLFYSFWLNPKKQDKDGFYEISIEKKNGWIEVAPAKSQGVQTVWRWGKPKSEENLNINIVGKDNQNGGYQIVEKYREKTRLARSVWWDKEVNSERGTLHLKNLFKGKIFDFPKPEELIKRVIEIGTQKGDLVLDFHLGSGTTASVAHKMERRYIGVEQMDYIENIPVKRLIKVIEGEDGGVSKAVKWEGGGSFVYAELLKNNQKFIEEIEKVKSDKDIKKIYKEMQGEAFFRYDIDIQKLKDKSTEKSFDELDLNSKKNILLDCLDANHLYVNYSDIEDNTFKVDKKDVVLNKKFYE